MESEKDMGLAVEVPAGEPAHTTGPWVANGVCVYAQPFMRETTFQDEDGNERPFTEGLVALVYSCGANNMEANARLIAASPQLLAALRELLAAFLAEYPAFEAGKEAQDAWSNRRAVASDNARAAIAAAEGK